MYSIFENRKKRVHTTSLSLSDYVLNRFSGACSKVTLLFDFITYYYIRLYCRLSPWCTYSLKTPIIKVLKKIKFPSLGVVYIYIHYVAWVAHDGQPWLHTVYFFSLSYFDFISKSFISSFFVYRVSITPLGHRRFPLFLHLYRWITLLFLWLPSHIYLSFSLIVIVDWRTV